MVDVFENAVSISIHDKDVRSIITTDGVVIWEKPQKFDIFMTFDGETAMYGKNIVSNNGLTIYWGDGTSDVITNNQSVVHNYTDGKSTHNIVFAGEITSLGTSVFQGNHVTYISLPNTVTSLGDNCFMESGISEINIPDSVVSFGISCFKSCFNLTSVEIPSSITRISDYCFFNCYNLVDVIIPNTVVELGTDCFKGCYKLTNYELFWTGNNVLTYDSTKLHTNSDTVFTIPNGSASDYIAKGYPSDKLVERSE